jgi:hypothetical protein
MTAHDWDAIERQYRAGQLSIKELARQHRCRPRHTTEDRQAPHPRQGDSRPLSFERWHEATGLTLLDGCGSTEMLHIWMSRRPGDVQPGPLGRPTVLFEVQLRDDLGRRTHRTRREGLSTRTGLDRLRVAEGPFVARRRGD